MKVDSERESKNVEDLRGKGTAKKVGCGCGGGLLMAVIVVVAVVLQLCGVPIGDATGQSGEGPRPPKADPSAPAPHQEKKPRLDGTEQRSDDDVARFTKKVLATTEDHWRSALPNYRDPTMVLFDDGIESACGYAESAIGPFYCGDDQKLYIDVAFFRLLRDELGSPGDFAQAYVVAHEVGHHIQKLTGLFDEIERLEKGKKRIEGKDGPQVRMELQADCYAGMWAASVKSRNMLEAGDVEEAMRAASRIGDDYLQKRYEGHIMPDGFTHGTSAQRVKWFKIGMAAGGKLGACDTKRANPL